MTSLHRGSEGMRETKGRRVMAAALLVGCCVGLAFAIVPSTLSSLGSFTGESQGDASSGLVASTALSVSAITISIPVGEVGVAVTFSATASGGTPPYDSWIQETEGFPLILCPPGTISGGDNQFISLACAPTTSGPASIGFGVCDSDGACVTPSLVAFQVNSAAATGPPVPSTPSNAADEGQTFTLTTTPTPGEGVGPFSYAWTADSALGCTIANAPSISCTPTTPGGPYGASVQLTDSLGVSSSVEKLTGFTVDAQLTAAAPSITLDPTDVGELTDFISAPLGGSGGYSFVWNGLSGSGCTGVIILAFACEPSSTGTYVVSYTVTDSNGNSVTSPTTSLTVDPALNVPTPTGSPPSGGVDVGQPVTFTSDPTTGGTGSGTYSWLWDIDPSYFSCGSPSFTSTGTSIGCTALASGTTPVNVWATDGNSNTVLSGALEYQIDSDPTVTISDSRTTADVGQPITFTAHESGGSGFYSYSWSQNSGAGCTLVDAATITCTPSGGPGTYQVGLTITDTNGVTSPLAKSPVVVVYSDPTVTTPVAAPPGPVDATQQPVTFSTTASGGLGPYTFAWAGLPPGCSGTTDSITCTPSSPGTYTVSVTATDANGFVTPTSGTVSLTVDPKLVISVTATRAQADVGQPVTFTATASGGSGPGTYNFAWSGLPVPCVLSSTASTSTEACVPSVASTYHYSVSVTDGNSETVSTITYTFPVFADPTVATPVPSHPGADIGELVTFDAATTGGAPPLSYVWHGLPYGCSSANVDPISCTPKAGGNFMVSVVVTDSDQETVTSAALPFSTVQGLDIHTPSVNHNPGTIGETVTFSVQASTEGKGPYTYSWNGLPGGCLSANSLKITCTLTAPTGTFHVSVTTTDANGAVKTSASLKFTVKS